MQNEGSRMKGFDLGVVLLLLAALPRLLAHRLPHLLTHTISEPGVYEERTDFGRPLVQIGCLVHCPPYLLTQTISEPGFYLTHRINLNLPLESIDPKPRQLNFMTKK